MRRSYTPVPGGLSVRAVVALCLAGGCASYERAEIEIRTPARPARGPTGALLVPGGPSSGAREDRGDVASGPRIVLAPTSSAARAELGLLTSALAFVGADARQRSAVDGIAHFSGGGGGPSVAIRIDRADPRMSETWLLDRRWAMRRLGCGVILAWEGDIVPVLERLSLIVAGRSERPRAPD